MPKRTAAEIWEAALGSLQVQVSATAYDTWLRGSRGQSFERGAFTVAVSSAFVAEWLDRRMRSLIERTLIDIVREPVQVAITVATEPSTQRQVVASALEPRRPMVAPQVLPRTGYRPAAALGLRPRPDLTFSTFVVAANSKLAFAAAASVADRPAASYNPLVLHGSAGLGKTHLLHAIANAAAPEHHTIMLMTAEQFVTEFVSSVRARRANEFQIQCRAADLFIVDDVQFICGKARSEENLFHTCASLLRSGKQVVLAADRRLQELPFTHRGLASQLQVGLTVDLQPPDQEARLAILAFKASRSPIPIPGDVLHYLAGRPSPNVRAMESELTRIIALATLTDQPLTLSLAVEALSKTGLPRPLEAG
ncbi:MAG: DnaA/Hda family protein, partial [Chloroflexi bacterium]|nr:DnaA/Hda family protein [Chloroflexota bacterium]